MTEALLLLMGNFIKNPDRNRPSCYNEKNGLYASNAEFTVKIDIGDTSYTEFKRDLYLSAYQKLKFEELDTNNVQFEQSPIKLFIRDKIKEINSENSIFLVLTDYDERNGSFLIMFSLFAFATFTTYGGVRGSLDTLKKDLDFFLKDNLAAKTKVSIEYTEKNIPAIEQFNVGLSDAFLAVTKEIKSLKLIVLLIGFFAIALSAFSVYKTQETPSTQQQMDGSTIRAIIRDEFQKIRTESVNEELLKQLQQQNRIDTTKNKQDTISKRR
jgi:hypothetical protein